MDVSVVIPLYNEVENLPRLHRQLQETLAGTSLRYEIVFVDDGSQDGTTDSLRELAEHDETIKPVYLRRNYGQTAALRAGIDHAHGEVIVTMDGDLQNDPADIPRMLAKLEEGYDLVHGWRRHRQDRWLDRRLPSMIANWLISRTTRFPVHDLGCTLKAIRREIATELELHGEMHRFIPILAHQLGARCVELEVKHHPRRFGQTKYGISRTFRVLLDLLTVKYLLHFFTSPMKLFGGAAMCCATLGMLLLATSALLKVAIGADVTGTPFLLTAILFLLASLQLLSVGLLGEVNSRIYFAHGEQRPYRVRTAPWDSAQTVQRPRQVPDWATSAKSAEAA